MRVPLCFPVPQRNNFGLFSPQESFYSLKDCERVSVHRMSFSVMRVYCFTWQTSARLSWGRFSVHLHCSLVKSRNPILNKPAVNLSFHFRLCVCLQSEVMGACRTCSAFSEGCCRGVVPVVNPNEGPCGGSLLWEQLAGVFGGFDLSICTVLHALWSSLPQSSLSFPRESPL